jgi:hypothetical protein
MEEMEALHDLRQVQGRTVPFWDRVTGRGRSGREEPPLDAGVPRTDEKGP